MKASVILNRYFNTEGDPEGYKKRSAGQFAAEMKVLTKEEKAELAALAAVEMGVEVD